MAQVVNVNFRMDAELKKSMEDYCSWQTQDKKTLKRGDYYYCFMQGALRGLDRNYFINTV